MKFDVEMCVTTELHSYHQCDVQVTCLGSCDCDGRPLARGCDCCCWGGCWAACSVGGPAGPAADAAAAQRHDMLSDGVPSTATLFSATTAAMLDSLH